MSKNPHFTKFEKAVLKAVRRVPAGRVTTYVALARVIGRPRAARAVGQALNKNPHLITVPCHRVVRADGSLGGYRGGAQQKKKLLASEGIKIMPHLQIENFSTIQHHW